MKPSVYYDEPLWIVELDNDTVVEKASFFSWKFAIDYANWLSNCFARCERGA